MFITMAVMRLMFSYFNNWSCFFFLSIVSMSDEKAIGIMFSRLEILRLEAGLAEQTFNILETSLKLYGLKIDLFKAREQLCLSNFGHITIENNINLLNIVYILNLIN